MKRILATTALALIVSGGSYTAMAAPLSAYQSEQTDVSASDFIDMRIYATEALPTGDVQPGAEAEWDDVGEINDVIFDRNGQVKAAIVGVGGFLGMGEKNVAISMQDLKFVRNGDGADDFYLVINANKESLTNATAYLAPAEKAAQQDAAKTEVMPSTTATNETVPLADPAADTAANSTATDDTTTSSTTGVPALTDQSRTPLPRPEITREGYATVPAGEITATQLEGAIVYGPGDENVGEINRIILSTDGKVERVVLDVGGFLGMGERQIAVAMDELNIVKNATGDDFRVYIDANQANLKAQPEFKG